MAAPNPILVDLVRNGETPTCTYVTMPTAISAIEHGLAPLLDAAVQSGQLGGDHDALVQLAVHRLDSAAAAAAVSEALAELLEAAATVDIEIGLLKGVAIGARWYAQPDLRPAVDLDVFVNPDQADRLGEFVELLTGRPASRRAIDAMVAEGRVFEYSVGVRGVTVDVHIDPMNLVVLTHQRRLVWQRSEALPLPEGPSIKVLDLETSIIQALLHVFRDNFADLLHLHDVLCMVNDNPDWDFITDYAATEGLTDVVRFSLGFVCDVFDRPSPLPRTISPASRLLIRALWPARIRLKGNESIAKSYRRQTLASLLIKGRRLEVARALGRRALPPRIVIDDRFEGCDCPYPMALLRWRLAQRAREQEAARATNETSCSCSDLD